MEDYNNKCDIHFITTNKYSFFFHSDIDKNKFIILKNNNKLLWCKYKILCSYNLRENILKKSSDMIIIEKSIIDDKLNYKSYKNFKELNTHIQKNVLDYYIGYIVIIGQDNNICFFIGINEIIRF